MEWMLDLTVLNDGEPSREVPPTWIRATERHRDIPVAVLSSCPENLIQKKLVEAGVTFDCDLTKPSDLSAFLQIGPALTRLL